MSAATGRYKPFPKTKANANGIPLTDLNKLKELYLSGPDYDWAAFCNRNGFNPKQGATIKWQDRGFSITEWKREWLKRQTIIQDDEVGLDMLAMRKRVVNQRISFVGDWIKRATYMKAMLDAMLKIHGEALQHDIDKTLAIQAGQVQRKFRMTAEDLAQFAATALKVQELEMKSLLLVGDKTTTPKIAADGTAQYEEHDHRSDHMRDDYELEVATMRSSGMSSSDTAKLLASYFDQMPKHINGTGGTTIPHINGTNGSALDAEEDKD